MSSTKWNEDVAELPEKFQSGFYSIDKSFSTWYKDVKWYDELLDNAKNLEEIYIKTIDATRKKSEKERRKRKP